MIHNTKEKKMIDIIKPYGDNDLYSRVELIASTEVHSDKFTADQMPSLAARVSHADSGKTGELPHEDQKLMKFLADHHHWSCFEHTNITFLVTAPLFVIREMQRHRSMNFNEESMRYTDDPVGKLFTPQVWRQQCSRNKQGSAEPIKEYSQDYATNVVKTAYKACMEAYESLQKLGVCREQARIVVPVGNYSSMYMTGNMRSWVHFCNLRVAEDAQQEIRVYANAFDKILTELYPDSWGSVRSFFEEKIVGKQ
jgi:thymidylate synthase (FAD)